MINLKHFAYLISFLVILVSCKNDTKETEKSESNTIEKGWDGIYENKKIQQGSYFYHIEVLGEDGDVFNKTGIVQVMF